MTPIPKLDPPTVHVGPYKTSLERIPRVDETECVGCNLCSLVCPVDECITMVERPTGLAPETWAERTSAVVRASAGESARDAAVDTAHEPA